MQIYASTKFVSTLITRLEVVPKGMSNESSLLMDKNMIFVKPGESQKIYIWKQITALENKEIDVSLK